jgi:alpha-maltose-1-phosphate synthase
MILFGHPTGGPFSYNAALAHFEAGRLEAFCVPWMPTSLELSILRRVGSLGGTVQRLERRHFAPLEDAPKIEDRLGEWMRLSRRAASWERNNEAIAYEGNDWLMRTMRREARRRGVTAVHSYEDCSLLQFEEAARLDRFRIYDLPIGYYPAWIERQQKLTARYRDWLVDRDVGTTAYVRPEQKLREMALADLVMVPSEFVRSTVAQFTDKPVAIAPYGVDLEFWNPGERKAAPGDTLQFVFAGQCSIRKGTPLLLDAWKAAGLRRGSLTLVGSWQMAASKLKALPEGVTYAGHTARQELRERYRQADVFVLPTFFEGLPLVLLEAMACSLPAIATEAASGPQVLENGAGRSVAAGDLDALVEALRWFDAHRDQIPAMAAASRRQAEQFTWKRYREVVSASVARYC